LNVLVERKTRVTKITKLPQKTAEQTREAIIRRLKKVSCVARGSITYDNGSENTHHEAINQALKMTSYFCEPYHSWEKGTVEQTNGLIRRYFPKKTNFNEISNDMIRYVEDLLNNRPRKCLNFKTPSEVFNLECGALAA